MTEVTPTPDGGKAPESKTENLPAASPKPTIDKVAAETLADATKIGMVVEATMTRVMRRETGDPYAGLPAPDVLKHLNEQFPEQEFPERMLRRLEIEQEERHARERRIDEVDRYNAETDRMNAEADRTLQKSWGQRAERVLYVLVAVGLICLFTGHVAIAGVVLGTTLVGVVGAFLGARMRRAMKQ